MPIPKAEMMMMIILFISTYIACSGLEVRLELASSEDNSYNNCIDGILSTDKIRLIGEITGFKGNKNLKHEIGQILMISRNKLNETDVRKLQPLDFNECNQNTSYTLTCEISIDNKKIMTNYTESARTAFNNVSLFLSVSYDKVYNSSLLELPRIYDVKNITVFVNNKELSKNGTIIVVKDSTLLFHCPNDPRPSEALSCNQTSLVESNQTSLVLENVDMEKGVYTFVCKECNSELFSRYTPCVINETQKVAVHKTEDKQQKSNKTNHTISTIILCVALALSHHQILLRLFG